jgi:hypothetical protein
MPSRVTSNSGASMALKGVCHFSRYWVAALALVTVTLTTTLSLFARLWRSGVTLTVTPPAKAACALTSSAAPMIVFQSISLSQWLSKPRL